jgi:hypothetical protein
VSSTRRLVVKGDYGTAIITHHGESIVAVLKSRGHASISSRYEGRFGRDFGVAQATSAAAHGPDADLCTEGPDGMCPHVRVKTRGG